MKKLISLLILVSIAVMADQEFEPVEKSWLDETHQYVSQKVYTFSHHLDEKLTGYACLINSECVSADDNGTKEDSLIAVNDWFSSLFRDELFDEVYMRSYLILRITTEYDYRTKDIGFSSRLKASFALPKIQEHLNFYIEDNSDDLTTGNYGRTAENSVGFRYFPENKHLLKSSFSVGINSLDDPFIKAYFWFPYEIGQWNNLISQSVKYSINGKFEDETKLYFDRILKENAFLRFEFGRWSRVDIDGMQYLGNIAYHKTTKYNQGFKIGVFSLGQTEPENEITQYAVYGVYKQNIYRKWLFYELESRVEWDSAYHFEPNYKLLVSMEVFFGDL